MIRGDQVDVQGATATPGWYADPTGAPNLRWWSGAGWTGHTAAHPVVEAPARTEQPAFAVAQVGGAERIDGRVETGLKPVRVAEDLSCGAVVESGQQTAGEPGEQAAAEPVEQKWWEPSPQPAAEAEPSLVSRGWTPTASPVDWNSAAAWKLAFIPLAVFALSVAYTFVGPALGLERRYAFGIGITALIISIRMAKTDRAELARLGLSRPPSVSWLLLGAATYLGIRFYRISKLGGRAGGPFWVALATTLAQLAITALSVAAILATGLLQAVAAPSASDISAGVQNQMLAAGYDVVVTCPTDAVYAPGSTVACAVADPNAAIHEVDVSVSEDTAGLSFLVTGAR